MRKGRGSVGTHARLGNAAASKHTPQKATAHPAMIAMGWSVGSSICFITVPKWRSALQI
jgi:hypothetical protein